MNERIRERVILDTQDSAKKPTPRYPSVDISFNEGDKVTLKNGRQGRIYKVPFWDTTAESRDGEVYVYFFPKGKRDPDLVEAIPLTDIMPHIGWK